MELRQLRYFVRVVDVGSLGRAAKDFGLVTSALSQQVSKLESELSTRLLQRSPTGVRPTEAGIAFYSQAQLALRHADDAVKAAQCARLSGHVSVGLPSTTSTVLGMPLIRAMRDRYPEVRLRLVEGLSGMLAGMLAARQLDLAILFDTSQLNGWGQFPLLDERLFLIGSRRLDALRPLAESQDASAPLADIAHLPLVLPSRSHGLRLIVEAAFARQQLEPQITMEVDGLSMLLDAVREGVAATIQPGAAAVGFVGADFVRIQVEGEGMHRLNALVHLREDELSPACLATRIVMKDVASALVSGGLWPGATLHLS